jgi:hypothetical protein
VKTSLISCQTLLSVILLLAACGQEAAKTTPAAEEAPAKPMGGACRGPAMMTRTPSAAGARVFFITPADGDVIKGPVHLEFGLGGMDVAPAGDDRPGSGHHHLIIDAELPPLDQPVPADDHHVHFGDGRTTTELTLSPGQHTLQLLFADHLHIPHDPPLFSERITITVE